MFSRIVIILLSLIALPLAPGQEGPSSADAAQTAVLPLHTDGRWIVDATGMRVKLRAVNWYGAEEQDHVVAGLEMDTLARIAHRIKAMGFNAVRLPWSNELYETNPIVPDYTVTANPQLKGRRAMRVFDEVVHALAGEGLFIILDNHMSNGDWCCSGNDGNTLWYNAEYPESSWLADWRGMAARYANVPEVIGADLRNELRGSVTWGGSPVTDWHAAAERGGNAVLSANSNLLIFVEGINYAADLKGVAKLPVMLTIPNRLVYSAHDYPFFHNNLASEGDLFNSLQTNWGYIATPDQPFTAPVWIGEFGNCHNASSCLAGSDRLNSRGLWMTAFRDYLAQNDFDWSCWALNGTQARGTSRTFGAEETYGILNPYWNAPAIPSELNPAPVINLLGVLQTITQPSQGPGVSGSNAPVVSLVTPLPGSLYSAGSTVHLSADAAVAGAAVSEVQFYANGRLIGSANASPFTYDWLNVEPGSYTVKAVAIADGSALQATSTAIHLSVFNYAKRRLAYGDSISLDFGNYQVTSMDVTETAGVIPRPNWNDAYGNTGFLANLLNQDGVVTTAAASWTSAGIYYTNIGDTAGDFRMMKGYQDSSNTVPVQVKVSGIPFESYDVYVYFDGANGTASREANYRLQAACAAGSAPIITGLDAAGVDFSGAYTQASGGSAGNYIVFPHCTGDSFILLAVHGGSSDSQYRAPVNGIQIIANARSHHGSSHLE